MRILVLHQNKFERMSYDVAIDHDAHEVVYAGARDYISGLPTGLPCGTFVWDPAIPIVDQLLPWMKDGEPFDRVLARHERTIVPAAALREEFGIPGMRLAEAVNFRDKVAMKGILAAAGIRVPRFLKAGDLSPEAGWTGKTIVKPREESGSQGIRVFPTYREAYAFVEEQCRDSGAPFADRYEVEEFLDGPIWHVDGFLYDGQPAVVQASRYVGVPLDFEHGQPIGSVQHPAPELESWTVRCVRALGGRTLTFHLEAIMTETGPAFMEVAARCGGSYIMQTVERKHGVNLHVLDMASEVEGKLATRFLDTEPVPEWFGIFLYPGRRYRGAPVDVVVPDELLRSRRLVARTIRDPRTPTRTSHSYRPEDLPFSGLVSDADPEALSHWLRELFGAVTVTPRPGRDARQKGIESMIHDIAVDCGMLSADAVTAAARASIAEHRLAYLRNFPVDVDRYIALLENLGELCPNYAAGAANDAYRLHPAINVVRCRPVEPGETQRVQEKSGPLPMHSGRSFARRRPLHLAMLMADPGWVDGAPGDNGESLIVRWGDVFAELRRRFPGHAGEDLRLLTATALSFPASHLDEEPSELPFTYVPGTPRRTPVLDDIAARLPQDLSRLRRAAEGMKDGERWFAAVERFVAVANDPQVQCRYPMSAGDVVIIDNDRYGHGRCNVIPTRTSAGGDVTVNPRVIWSVNIQ